MDPELTDPVSWAFGVVISVFPSILNSFVIQLPGAIALGFFATEPLAVNVFPLTS